MHTPIIIIFLLFLSHNIKSEDCQLVETASNTATTNALNVVSNVGMALFESTGPFETCVGTFMQQMGMSTFSSESPQMECTISISQVMNQDFRDQIADQMSEYTNGYDNSLNSFNQAYSFAKSQPNWQAYMTSVTGPFSLYLAPLNAQMIVNNNFFFAEDSANIGYSLVVLPYLADYINMRVMIMADLFTWLALNGPAGSTVAQNLNYAFATQGQGIYNFLNNAVPWIDTQYTQANLNTRTAQISCNAGSPEECGTGVSSSCCGYTGGCGEGGYCWDALFDTPDTWNPGWHATSSNPSVTYPNQVNCFYNPDYCPGGPSDLCMGPQSAWVIADNQCNADVTAYQNYLMTSMTNAVNNINNAITNGKNTYAWMCKMAGQPQQAIGCFTGDDLIQLESGETVSFSDLEVGDKIAVYYDGNDTYGFSEIGFMAVYSQINPAQAMEIVEICFGAVNSTDDDSTNSTDDERKKRQVPEDSDIETNSTTNSTSPVDDILSSLSSDWPSHGVLTPLGADCVKLTQNHAVKLEDGSYIYAGDVSVGDVLYPNSVVTGVSLVTDMGPLLIVPLPWDSPFLVLDGGIILSIFGFYGGAPPEQQEQQYQKLMAPFYEICQNDNTSCSELREIYQGLSVLASTFVQQTTVTANSSSSSSSSSNTININPTEFLQQAANHRVTLQQMEQFMNEHIAYMDNVTQSMIDSYLEENNITLINGSYVGGVNYGGNGGGSSSEDADSTATDNSANIKSEIIGISVAVVVVAILVVVGIVYFVKTRNSAAETGYQLQ